MKIRQLLAGMLTGCLLLTQVVPSHGQEPISPETVTYKEAEQEPVPSLQSQEKAEQEQTSSMQSLGEAVKEQTPSLQSKEEADKEPVPSIQSLGEADKEQTPSLQLLEDGTQDPQENVAYGKQAFSSSNEDGELTAAKAVDGDTTGDKSRWSSAKENGPHWIYVDLGKVMNVGSVRIVWETRKATSYKIQIAEVMGDTADNTAWTDMAVINSQPSNKTENFSFSEIKKARYVRLLINSFNSFDEDTNIDWNTISIYEMEVYGGEVPADSIDDISVVAPQEGDTTLRLVLPKVTGKTIKYNGTDYEQLIDDELNIYRPVVDTQAKVSIKITDNNSGNYQFKELNVMVPGEYEATQQDNPAPNVLPQLREWKGKTGNFTISDDTRIVYKEDIFQYAAQALAKDYESLMGKRPEVIQADTADEGDIFFSKTTGKGLFKEGYLMDIGTKVVVEAEEATGAYWATRTILQSIKADGYIPQGIARDYPLYEVRGFILDVGRKTFTIDYLRQVVQELAWYKMNDFQIHLNDNYIWIEEYLGNGKDPMQAYSGFRLESDIKKGGNGGKNQADLTSKDVFYTKEEFRNLILEARACGVNIVPEIDVPAHSLALTKVRPDLKQPGSTYRESDHLALASKFDECVEFVQSIFDEYMGADLEDPVFDTQTTVHIGCDEYEYSAEAFRRFCNSMIDYVQGNGRKVRFWGSLTRLVADVEVRSKDVQVNLWSKDWARMDQMYEGGYDLVNCLDSDYYIVPNAGYYKDYLNNDTMYNLPINTNTGVTIPAGDEQMLGGAFAVWNDMTDRKDNGVSEYDVYDRIKMPIALFGAKLWGKRELSLDGAVALKERLGSAPGTNFGYLTEDENGVIAHYTMEDTSEITEMVNASFTMEDGKNVVRLKGNSSYAKTPLTTVCLGNDLRVKVKRSYLGTQEQILFESPYGSIKAVQKDTGRVGVSRENMDYSFNYTLPLNQWVELEFKNSQNTIQLYVNGELKDTLGDNEYVVGRPLLATMMFPMEYIGSKTKAFRGFVDDIRLGKNAAYHSTMELDEAIILAENSLKETENKTLAGLVKEGKALTDSFAPTREEIDRLLTSINEELEKVVFETADYSEVDYYIGKIPSELSFYTPESVDRLLQTRDTVEKDLPSYMQSVVDGYAVSLIQALNQLERNEGIYIVATASSYQSDSESPKNVLDKDNTTLWHTEYTKNTAADMPHWIQLQLKEERTLKTLTYVPRGGGNASGQTNGIFSKYEVQVSSDGKEYRKVAEGDWTVDHNEKVVTFASGITGKYVKLLAIQSQGNFGSAAEIRLETEDPGADVAVCAKKNVLA